MVKDTILYDRLEVSPNATEAVIKKAYNRLSKECHPDRHVNSAPDIKTETTIKFQDINQAKEILLDAEKRAVYDQVGMSMFTNGMDQDQSGGNPFADFGNIFGQGFPFSMGGMGGMPGMPGMGGMGGMPGMPGMGGMGGMGGIPGMGGRASMGRNQTSVENITESIDVTLEQLYNEETINFSYKQKVDCTKCNGEGSKNGTKTSCIACDGKGSQVKVVRMGPMIQQSVCNCTQCKGTGKVIDDKNKCESCKGKCFIINDKTIQIPLKAGLSDGNKINLSNKGHRFKNMKSDLIIIINVKPHTLFKRVDDNLFVDIDLKLYQALFGFDKVLTHLDGRQLHISSSCKTDVNTIRKITNEGMVSLQHGTKGDLYIRFTMELPDFTNLPNETLSQLKKIFQSFHKEEVKSELNISQLPGLTKTITTECNQNVSEKILELLNNFNKNQDSKNQRTNKTNNGNDSDDQEGVPNCVQQ